MLCVIPAAKAQLLKTLPGSDITIISGTQFSVENIVWNPTADFVISNTELTKDVVVINPNGHPFILRVYRFSANTSPFSGSVQLAYLDGAELNGIPENALTFNNHNGSQWAAYAPFLRDNSANTVLTTGLSNVVLGEFTLASQLFPLAAENLNLTAVTDRKGVVLSWKYSEESKIREYQLQHSTDGLNWQTIHTQAGAASALFQHQYIHTITRPGIHYYRLLLQHKDSRNYYSSIRRIELGAAGRGYALLSNPASGGTMQLNVYEPTTFTFRSSSGQLLWIKTLNKGRHSIDMPGYSRGLYWLSTTNRTDAVIIQ